MSDFLHFPSTSTRTLCGTSIMRRSGGTKIITMSTMRPSWAMKMINTRKSLSRTARATNTNIRRQGRTMRMSMRGLVRIITITTITRRYDDYKEDAGWTPYDSSHTEGARQGQNDDNHKEDTNDKVNNKQEEALPSLQKTS